MKSHFNSPLDLLSNPQRLYTVTVAGDATHFLFDSLVGQDALSSLSEYTVRLLHSSADVEIETLLGQELRVTIQTLSAPRYLHGLISHASYLGQEGETDRYYVYEVRVVPWFWLATLNQEFRIFQNLSVQGIVDQVLGAYQYSWLWETPSKFPAYEYCVQYGESDFQFVSRLLEREGLYYYFRHEEDKQILVLTDYVPTHQEVAGYELVPYFERDKIAHAQRDYMSDLALHQGLRSGSFSTDDYNFKVSRSSLMGWDSVETKHKSLYGDVFEWPGNYAAHDDGRRYAQVRMNERHHRRNYKVLQSTARGVATGNRFTLRNCIRAQENCTYLVLATQYDLKENNYHSVSTATPEQTGRRSCFTLTVQDAKLPFVPPRSTPKPRTLGPQTARVVGPAGQEIWTDEFGRVKVHFHWDRYDNQDEHSSCWIRVSSPWASSGFGAIQIPRIGDEVVVDFLNGDPDLPLITGRVYNDAKMPPWGLPANATQMGFYSRSSPGGESQNANAIRFEDKMGAEQLWIQAERNQDINVKKDETHSVGENRTKSIGQNETVSVGASKVQTIGADCVRVVRVDDVLQVGSNKSDSVAQHYLIEAGDSIRLVCGKTVIEMHSNGQINVLCEQFNITANKDGEINTLSGLLNINKDGRGAGTDPAGQGVEGTISQHTESWFKT